MGGRKGEIEEGKKKERERRTGRKGKQERQERQAGRKGEEKVEEGKGSGAELNFGTTFGHL